LSRVIEVQAVDACAVGRNGWLSQLA